MNLKKRALFWIILILIILLVLYFIFVFQEKSGDYFKNQLECEKNSDCFCSLNCGCVPKDKKEAECLSLSMDSVCANIGCQCINNKCIRNLTIDTEEEAIGYAKTDEDFINASNQYAEYFGANLLYNARLTEEDKWVVSVFPEDTSDVWYHIEFDQYGGVISRGYGEGA